MTEIAHGEVRISAEDHAVAELRRVEAEYRATMARIDRMDAEAKIGANTKELDVKLKEARDKVRMLKGERAEVELKADKKRLDAAIKEAEAEVRRLDGKKATVEIRTRGEREALANLDRLRKAEAARSTAEQNFAARRERASSKAQIAGLKEEQQAARLEKAYSRATDDVERLTKARGRAISRETKQKVEVDLGHARASMALAKKELEVMGRVPPVHIRANVDDKFLKRNLFKASQGVASFFEKLSSIGHLRLNLGPFSGTIRTMMVGITALAPLVQSLGASLVSLAGVLTSGFAGAAAGAGGILTGLALNFGGVLAAVKPAISDFNLARQATTAYQQAVDKYGKSSTQARSAQERMNNVLKHADLNAKQAALGVAWLGSHWRKLTTDVAHRQLGKVLNEGITTAEKLLPTFARNTNQTMGILGRGISMLERRLRTPAAIGIFSSLGRSANQFLGPVITAIGHLGAAFGHVAEAGARLFAGPAGQAINNWAKGVDAATQPGEHLNSVIGQMGHHFHDLMNLVGATGRLMTTILFGSANAGDDLVVSLTKVFNKWNEGLKDDPKKMGDFFHNATENTKALFAALAPLIAAFSQWAGLMTPLWTGFFKGAAAVLKFISHIQRLIGIIPGLGGSFAALAETMGAMWAVGKISTMIAKVIALGRALKAAALAEGLIGKAKAFGNILTGRAGKLGEVDGSVAAEEVGGSMRAAGATAAEAMATGIRGAGLSAAEAMGAAIRGAGGVAGAEEAAGERAGGAAAGATIAADMEAAGAVAGEEIGAAETAGGAAGAGEGAAGGLLGRLGFGAATAGASGFGAALATATGVIGGTVLAGAALAGGLKLLVDHFDSVRKAINGSVGSFRAASKGADQARHAHNVLRGAISATGSAYAHDRVSLQAAREELARTTKGTVEHRQALLTYKDALRQTYADRDKFLGQQKVQEGNDRREISNVGKMRTALLAERDAREKRIESLKNSLALEPHNKQLLAELDAERGKVSDLDGRLRSLGTRREQALNRIAAEGAQASRAFRDLAPLVGRDEQAIGRLARLAGGDLAKKVATQYADPRQAGAVARAANAAIEAGLPKRKVMQIVLNTRNAHTAINQLNAAKLKNLKLIVLADARRAYSDIRTLQRMNIGQKIVRFIGNAAHAYAAHGKLAAIPPILKFVRWLGRPGNAQTLYGHFRALPNIIRILSMHGHDAASPIVKTVLGWLHKIPGSKNTAARAHDGASGIFKTILGWIHKVPGSKRTNASVHDGASGILRGILGHINALHDRTVHINVWTHYGHTGSPGSHPQRRAEGGYMGGFAQGGEPEFAYDDRSTFDSPRPRRTSGEVVSRPTYLVGEENRPEIVLATNPAYRERNIVLWEEAGSMLGIPGFAQGGLTAGQRRKIAAVKRRSKRKKGGTGDTDPYVEEQNQIIDNEEAAYARKQRLYDIRFGDKSFTHDDGTIDYNAIHQRVAQLQGLISSKEQISQDAQLLWLYTRSAGRPTSERSSAWNKFSDTELDIKELRAQIKTIRATQETTTEYQREENRLEANLALAQIGQGSLTDALKALVNLNASTVEYGKSLLKDRNPLNDQAAYSLIKEAAGNVQSFQGQLNDATNIELGGGQGLLGNVYGGALEDLYRNFGTNIMPAFPKVESQPQRVAHVTNNYLTQPDDPHSYSQQLVWELESILG